MAPSLYGYYDVRTIPGRVAESSNARQLLEDARAGDVDAMRQLGKHLIDGTVMKRDLKNGVLWLKKAVEAGDDRSMVLLGDLYCHGRGVSKSEKKAVELYMQAAEAGNKNAVKRLEKLPLKSTVSWWEARANDGDKKAVLKLMRAYATGKGLPKDMEKARVYYEIAVREWPEDAEKILDKLSEEQRMALVPPPPPPAKPEPVVVQTPPTAVKTPTHSWKYVRCDSKYYAQSSLEETEKLYRENLELTNACLSQLPSLLHEGRGEVVAARAVGLYAMGEIFRITLMSKYHVTEEQLNRTYGHLISQQKDLLDKILAVSLQNQNAECYREYLYLVAIIGDGYGDDMPPDFLKESFVSYCDMHLFLVESSLKMVTLNPDDPSSAETAGYFWLSFLALQRYVKVTHPQWASVVQLDYYGDVVDGLVEVCMRIKQANYYGSALIKQVVVQIYGE